MALKDYPEWVLVHKKPGVEIRLKDGKYYLYKCSCRYDKETKKNKKVTGEYLGRITETDGLIPPAKRMVKVESTVSEGQTTNNATDIDVSNCLNLEYGFYCFYRDHIMQKYVPALEYFFPYEWQTLIAMSYCRMMYQSSLNMMESDFERSYLSQKLPNVKLSKKYLTEFINKIGHMKGNFVTYLRELGYGSENVIFDASSVTNIRRIRNAYDICDDTLKVIYSYSIDKSMPLGYIIDDEEFKDLSELEEYSYELGVSKDNSVVLLEEWLSNPLDKVFTSEKKLNLMDQKKIDYIVALARDNQHIDYSCTKNPDMTGFDGNFIYQGERIWYKEIGLWDNKHKNRVLYLYYNEREAKIESFNFKRYYSSLNDDEYTAKYKDTYFMFGTTVLACPKKDTDNSEKNDTAREKFFIYKTKEHLEESISELNNIDSLDITLLKDEYSLDGWMIVNYLALCWYNIMRNLITKNNLIKDYTPRTIFQMFTSVRVIKINRQWILTSIIEEDAEIFKKIGLNFSVTD